jgi:hypothetical protein
MGHGNTGGGVAWSAQCQNGYMITGYEGTVSSNVIKTIRFKQGGASVSSVTSSKHDGQAILEAIKRVSSNVINTIRFKQGGASVSSVTSSKHDGQAILEAIKRIRMNTVTQYEVIEELSMTTEFEEPRISVKVRADHLP